MDVMCLVGRAVILAAVVVPGRYKSSEMQRQWQGRRRVPL